MKAVLRLTSLLLWITLGIISCKKKSDTEMNAKAFEAYVDALPVLRVVPKDKPVVLKVRYVENKALPTLDTLARKRVYRQLAERAREVFGYDLTVYEKESVWIHDFFETKKDVFVKGTLSFPARAYLISFFDTNKNKEIETRIQATLAQKSPDILTAYFGEKHDAPSVTAKFLRRLDAIYAEPKADGKPLLSRANEDEEIWYSYGHWDSLLYAESSVDFILTNSGIIGADNGMPIYVIARGGVTSAFVENNAQRPYQGVGVFGLYPFLTDTPFFTRERGALSAAEKEEAVAWVWLHELGHLLLKKEENYTFVDSVHRAPPDLKYYEWVKKVRGSLNHHSDKIPTMQKF